MASVPVSSGGGEERTNGGDPLAGWIDLRELATEIGVKYRELLRNVPRALIRPLGRRRLVQRARFVAWWTGQLEARP